MSILQPIHFTVIREVHDKGTLSAAARELHLTQSALSHTIRKLEEQLGTPVWHRDGRRLRLTQVGEYLLTVANRILPQLAHAEERVAQFASGEGGTLRIGMECHPCYQWLLKIVSPYLSAFPLVDVDVKQKFQFGGIGALYAYEIDVLVTPDPLRKRDLVFEPVFDYEQVLVVGPQHPLRDAAYARPRDLAGETLITYPVEIDRLDVFAQFLTPAKASPKRHKPIETTDIMLQMVESGRGVAALPGWLVAEYADKLEVFPVRLGKRGIGKQIFLGRRKSDSDVAYLRAFFDLARRYRTKRPRRR